MMLRVKHGRGLVMSRRQMDRLAMAIVARMPPPMIVVPARVDPEAEATARMMEAVAAMTAPAPAAEVKPVREPARIGRERKRRRILTEPEVKAAEPLYREHGCTKAANLLGWPKQTVSSLATRMGWREPPVEPESQKARIPAASIPAPSVLQMARHVPAVAARLAEQLSKPIPAPAPSVTPAPDAPRHPHNVNVAPPPNTKALEPVPASEEDARDWLYAEMQREGGKRISHAEIEQRLAILTSAGIVAECNTRRIKHGLSPYALSVRAA